MKPNHLNFSLLVLISFCSIQFVHAQGFLKAGGQQIVNDKGEAVILRGVGLGGWMLQEGYMLKVENIGNQQHAIRAKIQELIGSDKTAAFYNSWLANHTRKIDVDSLAVWGFNSVRLPMHYNLFTLPIEQEPAPGQDTWLTKGFEMTDQLLRWCKANKMYLILDLHGAPGGQGNDVNIADRDENKKSLWESQANVKKTIALWRKLAERYANEPWIGGYDIINEPNWGFTDLKDEHGCSESKNEPLRNLMVEITKAIREVDKKHMIIIEGNCWGNNYEGILPLWDKNMAISFHKYWNFNDQASIQRFLDLRKKYNAPIWLGESGENSNVWFTEAIRLMESNGIGWCWWPLKKIGYNNPLEVPMTIGYRQVLDYWAGKGPKPEAGAAYESLMELSENLKLENCYYHKDVIDAMFRQVKTSETLPYEKRVLRDKLTILAVDFDLGRSGFAYSDKDSADYHISTNSDWTSGNSGRVYRNDGVDIDHDDKSGSYFVTQMQQGEWLQYSFVVEKSGSYDLKLEVSSESDDAYITVQVPNSATELVVPNTGNVLTWKNVEIVALHFEEGPQSFRIRSDKRVIGFKKFELKRN